MDSEKLNAAMDALPRTISGLLEIAVADLKKQKEAENSQVDMTSWLCFSRDGICYACLAGSVMRFSLGIEAPGVVDLGELIASSPEPASHYDRLAIRPLTNLAEALNLARMADFDRLAILCYGADLTDNRYAEFSDWLASQEGGAEVALLIEDNSDCSDGARMSRWFKGMDLAIAKLKELGL